MSYMKEISHCSDLFTGCGFQLQPHVDWSMNAILKILFGKFMKLTFNKFIQGVYLQFYHTTFPVKYNYFK